MSGEIIASINVVMLEWCQSVVSFSNDVVLGCDIGYFKYRNDKIFVGF
mgnify:CR=1 FL=1